MRRRSAYAVAAVIAGVALLFIAYRACRDRGGTGTRAESEPTADERRARSGAASPGRGGGRRDEAARQQLITAIRSAREQRLQAAAGSSAQPSDDDWGLYVVQQLDTTIKGLVDECYRDALHTNPKLAGSITVEFHVVGEPGLGGVIEKSEIDPRYTTVADHAGLAECVRESVYALTLPAPPSGGQITVNVPYELIPGRGALTPKELGAKNTVTRPGE